MKNPAIALNKTLSDLYDQLAHLKKVGPVLTPFVPDTVCKTYRHEKTILNLDFSLSASDLIEKITAEAKAHGLLS